MGFSPRISECHEFDSHLHLLLRVWLLNINVRIHFHKVVVFVMWLHGYSALKQPILIPVGDKPNASEPKLQISDAPLSRVKLVIESSKD